jgi:nucleolar protein 9
MPKQQKKRGRRAEQKRKLEDDNDELESSKRQRHDESEEQPVQADFADNPNYIPLEGAKASGRPEDTPFFGLLDEEEVEYFKKAGEMLELNQFAGPADREDFVTSVYTQAQGKELKLAFTQATSRTLERLIQLSSPLQLKILFQAFSEKYVNTFLVQC